MLPENNHQEMDIGGKLSLMELAAMIRKQLEKERDRINQEIKNYPRPIPGCDAQFNHLLEERTKIGEELKHIEVIYKKSVSGGEQEEGINEFIERSNFISREAVERIRTLMSGEPNSSD